MATAAQITANQQNARMSTGPQTPEGKAAASRNATTHGLNAVNPVLPHESQSEFDRLHAQYRDELEPEGLREDQLVRQIAEAQWRQHRLQRIEAEFIDQLATGEARRNPHAAIAASMLEKGGAAALERIQKLAAAAERAYHRNYNALARERQECQREFGRQLEAAATANIFAPLPRRPQTAPENRHNEPNPQPAATNAPQSAATQLRPAHTRNEANRESLALRL
jgi:hypothetical protein